MPMSPMPMTKAEIHLRLLVAIGSIYLAFITALPYGSAQANPMFRLEAKQGPNAVGLKVVEQYDYSRIFQPLIDHLGQPYRGERARPLQRYTREFLDAYLKHDAAGLKFLKSKPSEHGVPTHLMDVNFRPAGSMPPSLNSFRAEVGRRGFDHAAEIYANIQKETHDFKLDADAVVSWACELMADGHLPEAIDVINLAIQIDPSSRAYSGLAEAYMKSAQNNAAIESYQKALQKDRGNILAKQRLQELKKLGL